MGIVFDLKAREEIDDMEEFCRYKDELTYIGQFAKKETSEVIQGTIIQYDGKFYTTEIPFHAGVSCVPAAEEGMVITSVELFETDYVPEECKPLSDCPIRISIWNTGIDEEGPIGRYAFYDNQLKEAKEVVSSNEDVDIFVNGERVAKKDFLAS